MNTIIIHPNNRITRTPEHDLSAILIAPVTRWYRKPTPWWVDGFEEVCLQPIVEADEIVDEVEETEESLDEIVLDGEQVADEATTSEKMEYARTSVESNIDGADTLQDVVLDGNIDFDNDDDMDFFEDVILVDEVDNDDQVENEDDDDDETLTDITFTGKSPTFRLPVQFDEDYDWDEKAALSILAAESDLEDEGEDDAIDRNRSSCAMNQFFQ